MIPLAVRIDDVEARTSTQYAFSKSPVRVGRGELNDLRLDFPYVSTWHGLIQFDEEGIRFVDLGSTNGTWLGGVRLERNAPAAIGPDTDLRIGSLQLFLARRAVPARAPPPRPSTQFALRAADLAAPAAPPPTPEPAGAAPGADRAREAVEAASWQLGVLHDAYRQARENLEGAVAQAVIGLSDAGRRRALALVEERFPGAPAPGAAPRGAGGAAAPAGEGAGLLRAFAESYLPGGAPLEGADAVRAFLGAVAELLETSVKSYLELRRGYEEFGREMGLRVAGGEGGVGRFKDAKQLLAYLLQPAEGEPRSRELASAFADLMIHQVALLNGVNAGARELLDRLSPEAVTRALEQEGGGGLSLGVKALREGAQWRAYLARYRAVAEEESALSDALFGKAFARAYSAVAGGRGPASEPDDATPEPGAPPSRRR